MKPLTGSQTFLHTFSDTKYYWDPGAANRAAEQGVTQGLSSGSQGCRLIHRTWKILFCKAQLNGWMTLALSGIKCTAQYFTLMFLFGFPMSS